MTDAFMQCLYDSKLPAHYCCNEKNRQTYYQTNHPIGIDHRSFFIRTTSLFPSLTLSPSPTTTMRIAISHTIAVLLLKGGSIDCQTTVDRETDYVISTAHVAPPDALITDVDPDLLAHNERTDGIATDHTAPFIDTAAGGISTEDPTIYEDGKIVTVGLQALSSLDGSFTGNHEVAAPKNLSPPGPKLAVARPFSASDIDSLTTSFDIWDDYPPCVANEDSDALADLFLVYSQSYKNSPDAQEAADAVIDKFNESDGWGHCFGDVFAIDVEIDPDLDIYNPKEQDTNPLWVNGPNRQFERTIRSIQQVEAYETLYLMEGDSIPVKSSWLDALVSDSEQSGPFAILGSTYKGDKWDGFYDELPIALTNHINGNAIYNLTSSVLNDILDQLEGEASIPYDYRIAQLMPVMPNGNSDAVKETKVIANYASTNVLPHHINQDASIIHGANVFEPWSDEDEDLTLVISSWQDPDATFILSHLEDNQHPFSSIVLMLPPGSDIPVLEEDKMPSIPIIVHHRHDYGVSHMDLCNAPVSTKFFMMTNSYHRVRPNIALMRTAAGKPVISFAPATNEYCFKYPSCKKSIEHARSFFPGHDLVVQDFDMIYSTQHRNEMCATWIQTYGADGRQLQGGDISDSSSVAVPTATAYTAFVESQGVADDIYSFTDATQYGSRPPFVRVPTHAMSAHKGSRLLQSSSVNSTGCLLEVSEEECLGSNLECEWRPLFDSCHVSSTNTNTTYYYMSMSLDGIGTLSTKAMLTWQEETSYFIATYYDLDKTDVETVIISQSATVPDSSTRRKLAETTNLIQYKQRFVSESAESKAVDASSTTSAENVLTAPFESEDDVSSYIALLKDSSDDTVASEFSTIDTIGSVEIVDQPDNLETPNDGDDSFTPDTPRERRKGFIGMVAGIAGGAVVITTLVALLLWQRRRTQYDSTPVEIEEDSRLDYLEDDGRLGVVPMEMEPEEYDL